MSQKTVCNAPTQDELRKLLNATYVLVKRQYQKKDGSNGYSMELLNVTTGQSYRILTYKDDNRAYYQLDGSAYYIGRQSASKAFEGLTVDTDCVVINTIVDEKEDKKEGK